MAMLLPDAPPRAHTFDGLAQEIVEHALKHARIITARKGDILTQQGEPGQRILVIREGYVKMVSTSQDGHDVLVGIAGPRDAVGHAAMTDRRSNYLVTSCALTPVTSSLAAIRVRKRTMSRWVISPDNAGQSASPSSAIRTPGGGGTSGALSSDWAKTSIRAVRNARSTVRGASACHTPRHPSFR